MSRDPLRVALLGTGQVGTALLARLQRLGEESALALVHVANSRWASSDLRASAPEVIVDATASDAVAARHAEWLARGVHVVTANKLGQGASIQRWRAIERACTDSGSRYGDAATVGAGLPLLRTIRALRAGGDAIHGFAGVLSGSLAWLLSHHDGTRPFSQLVREARAAGYTEPDPRVDLSGEDVRRKLLILARAAGVALEADAVRVTGVSTNALAAATSPDGIDAALATLDAPLHARLVDARNANARLHFVARWHEGVASIGLEALPLDDPLAAGHGTDNRVAIRSARYATRPLVIQGPGAGADVTAAALLDDVFALRDARQVTVSMRAVVAAKNASIGWGRAIA